MSNEFWVKGGKGTVATNGRGKAEASQHVGAPVRNKYGAKKTAVDGIVFDSKREANRYTELKALERTGAISELFLQVKLPIAFGTQHICNFIADFIYQENGKRIVEDCKGFRTPVYRLKKKMVQVVYGVTVRET